MGDVAGLAWMRAHLVSLKNATGNINSVTLFMLTVAFCSLTRWASG